MFFMFLQISKLDGVKDPIYILMNDGFGVSTLYNYKPLGQYCESINRKYLKLVEIINNKIKSWRRGINNQYIEYIFNWCYYYKLIEDIHKSFLTKYFLKAIKEEIMKKVWHPKNIKRFKDWGFDTDE